MTGPWTCMTDGCGHEREDHEYGSCTKCDCYIYYPRATQAYDETEGIDPDTGLYKSS